MVRVRLSVRAKSQGTVSGIVHNWGAGGSDWTHCDTADRARLADYAQRADTAAHAVEADHARLADVAGAVSEAADVWLHRDRADATAHALGVGSLSVGTFRQGLSGAGVGTQGDAEFASIVSRSFLKVFELIYNRINALEGDYSFADSGTIETVTDNGDGSLTLAMRKRWEGDFTAFQKGDVLYGYVNDLDNAQAKTWGKAWVRVTGVDRAANTLTVVAYDGADVPGGVNLDVAEGMLLARWGNAVAPSAQSAADPDCAAFIKRLADGQWSNTRQKSFMLSSDGGNLVELMGVDAPIVRPESYAAVLGQLPEGLVDDHTASLLNPAQPYLYARGIVVQDLIRIGYNGVAARTPNFRGEWDAATAADAQRYYRMASDMADCVTWEGDLWQCLSDHAAPQCPSDTNPQWLRLTTAGALCMWDIVPSSSVIHIRRDGRAESCLSCTLVRNTPSGSTQVGTPEELDAYGLRLMFSLDGEHTAEFWVRQGDTVAGLETSGGEALELGGNNVPWIEVRDNIFLRLVNSDGTVLAETTVPVVRDGESVKGDDGKDGRDGTDGNSTEVRWAVAGEGESPVLTDANRSFRVPDGWTLDCPEAGPRQGLWRIEATIDGLDRLVGRWSEAVCVTGQRGEQGASGRMAYPCGLYSPYITYRRTQTTVPVVMDAGEYYVLVADAYTGNQTPANRDTPTKDAALGGTAASWERMDRFSSVFADIIMADFGKVGEAVFFGSHMISQRGTDAGGNTSEAYEQYPDGFTPNFEVDFKTGKVTAHDIEFYGLSRQKWAKGDEAFFRRVWPAGRFSLSCSLVASVYLEGAWDNPLPVFYLPTMEDALREEDLEVRRAYAGETLYVYNDGPAFARVEGYFITERTVDDSRASGAGGSHRLQVTKTVAVSDWVNVPAGFGRAFHGVLAADADTGFECLAWEVGEQVAIKKTQTT